jgi:hypothetical protein
VVKVKGPAKKAGWFLIIEIKMSANNEQKNDF